MSAAASNMPGARNSPVSWTDAAGDLWLYGGYAYNATGTQGVTDDLWEYSPATGQWTWMGGSSTDFNVAAVYGAQGIGRSRITSLASGRTPPAGSMAPAICGYSAVMD